ncbi:MAG: hypothetical protein ACJ8FS_14405 [Sphingomicrobium sp.]
MKEKICAALLVAFVSTAAGQPKPVYRTAPTPGVRHYVYQVDQTINGTIHKGYRSDFDLETKSGAVFADIRSTAELVNGAWKPVVPDPGCRKELNGGPASLARLQLYPIDPAKAHDLGASFLALCAPPAVFFPLTDILNVVVIPLGTPFGASKLRKVGDKISFQGFDAGYDRAGEELLEKAHGGETRLVALDFPRATLEWRPLPAELTLVEKTMNPPTTMQGSEHFAFRLDIERKTGAIERATTIFDDLDLKIVGAPDNVPHVRISRTVTIERR